MRQVVLVAALLVATPSVAEPLRHQKDGDPGFSSSKKHKPTRGKQRSSVPSPADRESLQRGIQLNNQLSIEGAVRRHER